MKEIELKYSDGKYGDIVPPIFVELDKGVIVLQNNNEQNDKSSKEQ